MNSDKKPASAVKEYRVKPTELPLSCPTKDMELWNAHPRVYLPLDESPEYTCPYCGIHYILESEKA